MAETTTFNYGWTKPDPGFSTNTWGATQNATIDKIDNQVFLNAQAGAPVGAILMFAGATPPSNWLLCNGASLATSGTYAALFAALGYAYGGSGSSFLLPNLKQKFPIGADAASFTPGITGGASTVTLDATMIPAHSHTASQAAGGAITATQAAHTHGVTQAAHSHAITVAPHSHVITPNIVWAAGATTAIQLGGGLNSVQVPNAPTSSVTATATADTQTPAITADSQTPAITVSGGAAGAITVANTGGGLSHNNMPPYLTVNFIIRAT